MTPPSSKNTELSSLGLCCLLVILHRFANSLLLSPWNPTRSLFWDKNDFTKDEAWIANWYSFAHFHGSVILACLASVSMGDVRLEVTLSYILTVVVLINFVAGIFSVDCLNPTLAYLQMGLLLLALGQFAYFTLQLEQQQNRSPFFQPRKLTSSSSSSSFSERQKLQVVTIAAASQFVSGLLRVLDMTFADGRNGYLGDMSSPIFKNISSLAVCDMMMACGILGAALRFYESEHLKIVLYGQVLALFVSQIMLAGSQGEMIDETQTQAGVIGTFVSIIVGIVGAFS